MEGVLLLDLGNRRLKSAWMAPAGGLGERRAWALPEPGDPAAWEALAGELAALGAAARELRLCSSNPGAEARLLAGRLDAHPGLLRAGPPWPWPVASRGTGADRVLAGRAAWLRGGGDRPALVADLGSAWTLDLVGPDGTFLGGAIGPGLAAQEAALARACPHLPPPGEGPVAGVPGDTGAALAAGTAGALAAALEGLARRFLDTLGPAPRAARFLAGGEASRIAPWLGPDWRPAPDLVLEGLAALPGRAQA